ncbi:copper resistance protein B [Sphingomonas koreensis]|nr:copper resistance protein B [Sphingomonas koreensis]
MMRLSMLAAVSATALAASPVAAQSMQDMQMPGMDMSKPMPARKKAAAKPPAKKQKPATKRTRSVKAAPKPTRKGATSEPMPGMTMPATDGSMPSMPGMDVSGGQPGSDDRSTMQGMAMPDQSMAPESPNGTDLPPGNAPPPPVPRDHYADRIYTPEAMQPARTMFRHENGGEAFSQVMVNLAELQIHDGRNGYRWEGEGWFGSDIDRFVVKSEGEGTFGKGLDAAEVQGLYSRAVGPYFNLQAGVRHDFQPSPTQTFATIGVEGLAPYQFDVSGALFLSTKGDLLARAEATYDERITQRLILQPRVELNFAAQDVARDRIGAGLSDAELGLRLRYEISRQFAPYIGISYTAKVGRSATFARRDGDAPHSTSLVLGIRVCF